MARTIAALLADARQLADENERIAGFGDEARHSHRAGAHANVTALRCIATQCVVSGADPAAWLDDLADCIRRGGADHG